MVWSPSERKKREDKCSNPKGFTMKQFCKNLRSKSPKGQRNNKGKKVSSPKRSRTPGPGKKEFLYNKDDPKKSFDVYIDKNPKDTIPIQYKNVSDVKKTIRKLERLYKNDRYPHKRIKQVAMIMMVRLNAESGKNEEKRLARNYHSFLGERTNQKDKEKRKKMNFKIN